MPKENEDENFYSTRGQWLDYLVIRRDLTHGDFRVAYFIASKIKRAGQTMWWSVPAIALELEVSIGTVTKATRKLDKKGLLVITKGPKGAHSYSMRMPIDPIAAAFGAAPAKRRKTGGRVRVSKNETG